MNVRESMIEMRREIIERLRPLNPLLVSELETVIRAIESTPSPQVVAGEFASLTIIEAAKVQLSRTRQPIAYADLTEALKLGGAGGATEGGRASSHRIAQSLNYHINKGKLTNIDGQVGLPEWTQAQAQTQ